MDGPSRLYVRCLNQTRLAALDSETTLERDLAVQLAPGAGAKLTLAMKRYANPPTTKFLGIDKNSVSERLLEVE